MLSGLAPARAEVGHDAAWAAQMAHAGHGAVQPYQQIGIELRLNWDPKTDKICLVKHCSNIARSNFAATQITICIASGPVWSAGSVMEVGKGSKKKVAGGDFNGILTTKDRKNGGSLGL